MPGQAEHSHGFSNFYKQKRSLFKVYDPSIGTMKGGNDVREFSFKPTLYERPKTAKEKEREREKAEDEADCSDNTVVRAYKKQQAHVEKLYWHEGYGGNSADRECACVYGEERHYKRPKRIRFHSARRTAKSREIWARLTRPKSAAPIPRKRDM